MCAGPAFGCPFCGTIITHVEELMCCRVGGQEHRAFACPASACGATIYVHRRAPAEPAPVQGVGYGQGEPFAVLDSVGLLVRPGHPDVAPSRLLDDIREGIRNDDAASEPICCTADAARALIAWADGDRRPEPG